MADDPRLDAARYRMEKAARDAGFIDRDEPAAETRPGAGAADARTTPAGLDPARQPTAQDRAAYVETAIQQAIRRGEFDNLPGSGKPLEGLGAQHDPDWWIRRKIQTEQLSGLGPPALRLRVEHAEFDARVDAFSREQDVRDYVDDFNRRVIEARRQLLGGPPVVTPTHDADEEVDAWRARRAARTPAPPAAAAADDGQATTGRTRRRWFHRR